MKRKLFALFLSVFFALSIWAKGPEKSFHYQYHDKDEGYSFSSFGLNSYYFVETVEDTNKWQVMLYRKNYTDYIVFYYKKKAPSQREIRDMLKNSQNIWKTYDEENGSPDVCHIFLDENGNFLYSAKYCEY